MKHLCTLFTIILLTFSLSSCISNDPIAVIWTNQTEFVLYAEIFNATQDKYKIIVEYKTNPADALIQSNTSPDVVIAPWLKGEKARTKFKKISNLLGDGKINPTEFYPRLLQLGNVNGNQYLLPVSFNLPIIIFSLDNAHLIKNDFNLSVDEIRDLSLSFNTKTKNTYSKMGFSPRWDSNFLYLVAKGFHSSFEEYKSFFTWNDPSLRTAVQYIRKWSVEINDSSSAEDDFKFKYLYDPPYTLVTSGRCLFWHLSSNNLFALPSEKLNNIDFRWINLNGITPIQDDVVYAGICKNAQNKKAASAFLNWFFNTETQKKLLAQTQSINLISSSFGIANGFSSLRSVTETTFPNYYPLLLKHLPQISMFEAPNILPNNWIQLKNEIITPYLNEACEVKKNESVDNIKSLNKKISSWYKKQ